MNHRFLTEDIPYGMVPVESLGARLGVPTPIISSLINIANEMLGVDFLKDARDLKKLGLDKLSIQELRQYVGEWKGAKKA
jgi:opine dehydrogenase